jgi:hypothetical protein
MDEEPDWKVKPGVYPYRYGGALIVTPTVYLKPGESVVLPVAISGEPRIELRLRSLSADQGEG